VLEQEGRGDGTDATRNRCQARNAILDGGVDVAHEVADIVAPVLGWDGATIEREVEHYRKRVAAERDSQEQLDDRTADSARLGAPEVRVGVG